jgi:hypothetical protein
MTRAKLIIRSPGKPDQEVVLAGGASIGLAFDNSIRVDVDGVSRYHAIIEQKDDGFWLSDLGSRNGTTVNGSAVSGSCKLGDGDSVVLGGAASLEFRLTHEQSSAGAAGTHGRGRSDLPNSTPEDPKAQRDSAGRRALFVGLAILAVVIGAFVLAQVLSPSRSIAGGGKTSGNSAGTATGGPDRSDSKPTAPPPENTDRGRVDPDKSETVTNREPTANDVQRMCEGLADKISQKGTRVFESDMVRLVQQRTSVYRDYRSEDAERYRYQINAAFSAHGLHPLLGFVTAMSRTKFKPAPISEGVVGLWKMPRTIARSYLLSNDSEAVLGNPKESADIAARYIKDLVVAFPSEDFMYALACFGMNQEKAYELKKRLDQVAPSDSSDRRNFWKMVKDGIVTEEQARAVIDFLAAGIVGMNPDHFDLKTKRLDSLYYS